MTVTNIATTEDQQPHQLSACCGKAKDRITQSSDVIKQDIVPCRVKYNALSAILITNFVRAAETTSQ